MIELPEFKHKEEQQEHLVENKELYITQKKSTIKKADGFGGGLILPGHLAANKNATESNGILKRTLIINTTKVFDSHADVHLDGLWKKALKERPPKYLLQEHKMSFSHVITRDIKAYTKTFSFAELGFKQFSGNTQALVFDAEIGMKNKEMYDAYKDGEVDNHSVGMQYVKLDLAINNSGDGYEEEFKVWEEVFDLIANKADAEANGYFWAIREAKAVEGSAVLQGSNFVTPTLEGKTEPSQGTRIDSSEPFDNTLQERQKQFYLQMLK